MWVGSGAVPSGAGTRESACTAAGRCGMQGVALRNVHFLFAWCPGLQHLQAGSRVRQGPSLHPVAPQAPEEKGRGARSRPTAARRPRGAQPPRAARGLRTP